MNPPGNPKAMRRLPPAPGVDVLERSVAGFLVWEFPQGGLKGSLARVAAEPSRIFIDPTLARLVEAAAAVHAAGAHVAVETLTPVIGADGARRMGEMARDNSGPGLAEYSASLLWSRYVAGDLLGQLDSLREYVADNPDDLMPAIERMETLVSIFRSLLQ